MHDQRGHKNVTSCDTVHTSWQKSLTTTVLALGKASE